MGGAYALDYSVVIDVARDLGVRRDRAFFEKLKAYEEAVLQIWGKKKASETDEEYEESLTRLHQQFGTA